MEPQLKVLVDTNIFIKIFREKDVRLELFLSKIPTVVISTIVLFELLQGEPNKQRYSGTKKYLEQFETIHLTQHICNRAVDLFDKYKFSKGLKYPDALIAATCLENDCHLWTYNRADFKFVSNLKLI